MPGQDVKGLSGGQRKLCIIAHINVVLSLYCQAPTFIVIDEPLAGVTSEYASYTTDLISKWGSAGHTVIVIDNDHREMTTTMGWTRVKLGSMKVIEYAGQAVEIPIPMVRMPPVRFRTGILDDLSLYFRHDLMNSQNLNNARVMMTTIMSLAMAPLSYQPQLDMGAILQSCAYSILFYVSSAIFVPGRIAMYGRIQSEAALGLIAHPPLAGLMTCIHDMLNIVSGLAVVYAVHSTGYQLPRNSVWNVWAGTVLAAFHFAAYETSVPIAGVGFAGCGLVQFAGFVQFFYLTGFFNPGDIAPSKTIYASPVALYFQMASHGTSYPPGVLDGPPDAAIYGAASAWLLVDFLVFTAPFWAPIMNARFNTMKV